MRLESGMPPRPGSRRRLINVFQSFTDASGCLCSPATSAVAESQVRAHSLLMKIACDQLPARQDPANEYPFVKASQERVTQRKNFASDFQRGSASGIDVSSNQEKGLQSWFSKSEQKLPIVSMKVSKTHKPDRCKWQNPFPAKFMQNYTPAVKYTKDPSKAYYESMMEIVMVGCLDKQNSLKLEDMFACYIMLNPSQNRLHIEEAFRLLLIQLYNIYGLEMIAKVIPPY